jgi:hypothetical protein
MLKYLMILQLFVPQKLLPSVNWLQSEEAKVWSVYYDSGINNYISTEVFGIAMKGLQRISGIENRKILTIIDYSKPSSEERFFVIDLVNRQVLFRTLVAHGKNSGEEKAVSFSNSNESLKSCLGFFLTAETYTGKNGYSLTLDGLEPGINDNARTRAIVIHGADYVSPVFISKYGRLGRSWGCPALPSEISKEIIDKISGRSCIFIYGNDQGYLKNSKIIKENVFK